jgi:hypothetical protein
MIATILLLTSSGIAQATRNPTPPPSGVVVHLFGPNSIMSDVAPVLPGESRAHATVSGAPGQPATGQNALPANGVETSDDPSWHDILHQMFIVGDPNDPNKPATGRPGERQNIQ